MADNIPAPPSGSIVDTDPLANGGSIPPPPSGSIVDADPAQHPAIDLSNPQGQGTYQMRGPNGQTVAVPYDQVPKAGQSGYSFAGDQDRWRYAKDNAADPARTGGTQLTTSQTTSPEDATARAHQIEDSASAPMQVIGGIAKGAATLAHPVLDLVSAPLTGGEDLLPSSELEARNGLQAAGKYGTVAAAAAPGAIAAPVATAAGLGSGTVSSLVGKVLGKHLGLNANQTALLSDLFGVAGGGLGGVAAAEYAPGGASSASDLLTQLRGEKAIELPANVNPVDRTAIYQAGKAGLTNEGQTLPTAEELQGHFQGGIKNIASAVAKDAGLEDYQAPESVRDAMGSVGRGMYSASKSDYAALDKASGGRWQRYDDAISNIDKKMSDVAGIDDDAYDNLQSRKNEIATLQAQLLEDMKAEGKVDPDIIDRANTQYRRAMALQDVGNAVKASTKQVVIGGQAQDVVDPNMLANRLTKLNDLPLQGGDSRLVQALGPDGADTLLGHVENAQVAFVPRSATGRVALEDLIRNTTKSSPSLTNRTSTSTDWTKALNSFEEMDPKERVEVFGGEVPKVQEFLQDKARWQNTRSAIKKSLPYVGGMLGLEALHQAIRGAESLSK